MLALSGFYLGMQQSIQQTPSRLAWEILHFGCGHELSTPDATSLKTFKH